MTDPTSTTTDTAVTEPAAEPGDDGGNSEAAKWRRRLREVEAERDRLAATVEAFNRDAAERAAGRMLANGSDLWLAGVELNDLLDDDSGLVDPDKVTAAAEAAVEARPHWAPHDDVVIDLGQGARGPLTDLATDRWVAAFAPPNTA